MISRSKFTTEFAKRVRFVVQKAERAARARTEAQEAGLGLIHGCDDPMVGVSDYVRGRAEKAKAALNEAETNLDAAIDQLADCVYDAMDVICEP